MNDFFFRHFDFFFAIFGFFDPSDVNSGPFWDPKPLLGDDVSVIFEGKSAASILKHLFRCFCRKNAKTRKIKKQVSYCKIHTIVRVAMLKNTRETLRNHTRKNIAFSPLGSWPNPLAGHGSHDSNFLLLVELHSRPGVTLLSFFLSAPGAWCWQCNNTRYALLFLWFLPGSLVPLWIFSGSSLVSLWFLSGFSQVILYGFSLVAL